MKEQFVTDLLSEFELAKIQFPSAWFGRGPNSLLLMLYLRNTIQLIRMHKCYRMALRNVFFQLLFLSKVLINERFFSF